MLYKMKSSKEDYETPTQQYRKLHQIIIKIDRILISQVHNPV